MRDANIHHRPNPSIADRSRASPSPSSSSSSSPTARTKTLFHHRARPSARRRAAIDAAPPRARSRVHAIARDRSRASPRTHHDDSCARATTKDRCARARAAGVASRDRRHTRTARRPFGHSDARPTARAFFPTPRALFRGRRDGGLCAGTYIRIIKIIKRYKKYLAQTREGARCRVSNFASPRRGNLRGDSF